MSGSLFPGPGITSDKDESRILTHNEIIWELMLGGGFWTLREVEQITGFPQASISAAFRSFRNPKFGGHNIDREHEGGGLRSIRRESGRMAYLFVRFAR